MMLKKLSVILLLFFSLVTDISSQDITGVWTGYISTNGNQLPYEIAISGGDDKLSGYSMTIFTIEGVENTGLKSLKIKRKKEKITIEDNELVEDNYSTKPKRVMLFAVLSLIQEKSTWVLSGNFNSRAYFDQNYKGTIHLTKKSDFLQTKLINKLGQLNLLHTLSFTTPSPEQKIIDPQPEATKEDGKIKEVEIAKEDEKILESSKEKAIPETIPAKKEDPKKVLPSATENVEVKTPVAALPAADIAKRKTETIQTVYFAADSLILTIYDNGQIDGDTVSVVLNGQTIIAQKRLTAEAITKTIYTPPGTADSLQLIMYAENLGTIPPNTGILIVQDGENRHEVRFEGDFQKNSAIILKRKRAF